MERMKENRFCNSILLFLVLVDLLLCICFVFMLFSYRYKGISEDELAGMKVSLVALDIDGDTGIDAYYVIDDQTDNVYILVDTGIGTGITPAYDKEGRQLTKDDISDL